MRGWGGKGLPVLGFNCRKEVSGLAKGPFAFVCWAMRSECSVLKMMFADLVVHAAGGDAKNFCCSRLVAIGDVKGCI